MAIHLKTFDIPGVLICFAVDLLSIRIGSSTFAGVNVLVISSPRVRLVLTGVAIEFIDTTRNGHGSCYGGRKNVFPWRMQNIRIL